MFIGIGMKEDQIEALLDTCLLTDQEMVIWEVDPYLSAFAPICYQLIGM